LQYGVQGLTKVVSIEGRAKIVSPYYPYWVACERNEEPAHGFATRSDFHANSIDFGSRTGRFSRGANFAADRVKPH
jgi:hypothetical protein